MHPCGWRLLDEHEHRVYELTDTHARAMGAENDRLRQSLQIIAAEATR